MHLSSTLLSISLASVLVSADPIVYLIRHGEKPSDGCNGLNAQGEQRAQCLRSVFGEGSDYDIGYIMAQTPDSGMNLTIPLSSVPHSLG